MDFAPDVARIIEGVSKKLGGLDPKSPDALEATAAFLCLQRAGLDETEAAYASEKIRTGGPLDGRLDAIAITINGRIVTPETPDDEIAALIDEAGDARTAFLCVQATGIHPRSRDAPSLISELSSFLTGVTSFLNGEPNADVLSERVNDWLRLRDRLFAIFDARDIRGNCSVDAYLVWPRMIELAETHRYTIDNTARTAIALLSHRFDEPLTLHFINEAGLVKLDQDLLRRGDIEAPSRLLSPGPAVSDKATIHTMFIPAATFVEMISRDGDRGREIKSNLFFDNVRAYLGDEGGVNATIRATLLNKAERGAFHLYNNGVAVIADEMETDGDATVFKNVQIVNGCQTSHAIFRVVTKHPEEDWSTVHVPARIVVATDAQLIDEMIFALNRQSEVDRLQLVSRRDRVIRLSRFIAARNRERPDNQVYFDRRTAEFARSVAQQERRVSLQELMTAYLVAFWVEPHVELGPSELVRRAHAEQIFGERDNLDFYYLAAVLLCAARRSVMDGGDWSRWMRYGAKSQMVRAMRLLCEKEAGVKRPTGRSGKDVDEYLTALQKIVLNERKIAKTGAMAMEIVDQARVSAKDETGAGLTGPLSDRAARAAFSAEVKKLCDAA